MMIELQAAILFELQNMVSCSREMAIVMRGRNIVKQICGITHNRLYLSYHDPTLNIPSLGKSV